MRFGNALHAVSVINQFQKRNASVASKLMKSLRLIRSIRLSWLTVAVKFVARNVLAPIALTVVPSCVTLALVPSVPPWLLQKNAIVELPYTRRDAVFQTMV